MKTLKLNILSLGCVWGLLVTAAAQPAPTPAAGTPAPADNPAAIVTLAASPPATNAPAEVAAAAQAVPGTNSLVEAFYTNNAPVRVLADGERALKLNFQNAQLQQVLQYLAKYCGFIVMPDDNVNVNGRVTLMVEDPMEKNEVVTVLNMLLNTKGYAFSRDGRFLRVTRADEYPPIIKDSTTNLPPATATLVTQIIPIKNVDASSLIQNISALLPSGSSPILTVSAGANAIVVQDTQIHIRRMIEIIRALDVPPLAAGAKIQAYPLQYANAKDLAQLIKDLFPAQAGRGGAVAGFGGGGRGGGRGGGGDQSNPFGGLLDMAMGGGGGRGASGGGGSGRMVTPSVVATADDRSNTLIVMATEEQLALITSVVGSLDTNVDDVTELRVFPLKNAYATDTATLLSNLFPNPNSTTQGNRGAGGMGARGGGFAGNAFGATTSSTGTSERQKRLAQVTAVADARANSVIVTASQELMVQVERVIDELDANPGGQINTYVYRAEFTDPAVLATMLQGLVPTMTGVSSSSMNNQNNMSALQRRQQNSLTRLGQQTTTSTIGSGLGGGGTGGGGMQSDRNIKTNFAPVNAQAVLAKVAALPITTWNYKAEPGTFHIGPMAQDFMAAFRVGADDKSIQFVDASGVALAAIKGLNEKLEAKDAKIKELEKQLAELKALVQTLVTKSNGTVAAASAH